MPQSPTFDPTNAVTFDLVHGHVHLEDAPSRVLVPAKALAALVAALGDSPAGEAFARELGAPLGVRVARRLAAGSTDGSALSSSVESVIDHLGGELALAGLGSLSMERWGQAMLLVVDQSPLNGGGDALMANVLAASLASATDMAISVVLLMRDQTRARFLITGKSGAEKANAWLKNGISWGEVLTRLHAAS
jgi:hypothetical protein